MIGKAGGSVEGEISIGSIPKGLEPVHVHRQSRALPEILTQMLLGSNNYVANQIFLEVGAHRLGEPVSLAKSQKLAETILAEYRKGLTVTSMDHAIRGLKLVQDMMDRLKDRDEKDVTTEEDASISIDQLRQLRSNLKGQSDPQTVKRILRGGDASSAASAIG